MKIQKSLKLFALAFIISGIAISSYSQSIGVNNQQAPQVKNPAQVAQAICMKRFNNTVKRYPNNNTVYRSAIATYNNCIAPYPSLPKAQVLPQ